jgi:hypothetical protein
MLDRAGSFGERTARHPRGLAHAEPRLDERELERSLRLGVSFLKKRQRADGVWKGFLLPPGAATTWLTAHVAWVVEDVPALDDACRRACRYLESVGPDDGGWGYNRRVGVDSDSTAQALLVLHRFGRDVPGFLLDVLLAAQGPDGGFATYRPSGNAASGWHAPHPDVTVVAAEALRRYGCLEPRQRALRWLEAQTRLASYWWVGPEYGLWAQARTGIHAPGIAAAVTAALAESRSTPQAAQVLAAGLALDVERTRLEAIALRLLGTQLADGSWPCSSCLRVTEPCETETRAELRGRTYADGRRIFSTAHAVAALFHLAPQTDTPVGAYRGVTL